jgi:hypothetical protein
MTDKLREAAQNILNGIETRAIASKRNKTKLGPTPCHNSAPPWRKRSRGRVMGQPSSARTL